MKEQEKTVRVRMMTQEKLEQENPQMAAKIRAAAEMIRANRTDCVAFHTEDGERKVAVSEIMYYMTDDRKLSVHTADGFSFQVKMTMKDMEELLKRESFLRLHRGCAVNRLYVRHILNGAVELTNGERLEVSRRRFPQVKEQISEAWEEKA
ncbi:MAG: LytTR family transcriptional regulator DNA-binding domain-containing protein [Lachnospiraceae bacterium]|nr:LytTR family transcriptional regulator DNA-binding domain-containing protein [Lachnospiraceae bacterium]